MLSRIHIVIKLQVIPIFRKQDLIEGLKLSFKYKKLNQAYR